MVAAAEWRQVVVSSPQTVASVFVPSYKVWPFLFLQCGGCSNGGGARCGIRNGVAVVFVGVVAASDSPRKKKT